MERRFQAWCMKVVVFFFAGLCSLNALDEKARVAGIPPGQFDKLQNLVRPQKGESPWREIKWLTNVTEARRRGMAEDKPLLFFTAADGSPLGRT
jgi:hypothetical protein